MLYACAVRFDVTRNLEKTFGFLGELNKALEKYFKLEATGEDEQKCVIDAKLPKGRYGL